ncbi:hypothetical protein MUO14_14185 [Halobacillus shinanisalinarum]|uniref:Uncharacterized protein n=1 Tax=Halobacillus shinanisalinarum TaxID=2932258 RepID=A0ABY4GUM9_9BACI|nr:hypothetical protein [Halobacillus shinanisalinarum]UOQ91694.1 hypothetical protein MUO14_14185 [Halobacillus shinanisalinarum]
MEHQSFPITTSFRATLKSNHGEEKELRYLAPYKENEEFYVASFKPFEKIPDSVTLTIEQVGLQSDQDYSFTVDVTDYKEKMGKNNRGEEVNVGKRVASLFNTDVYLKKKKYHLPDDSTFILTFEPKQENQDISLVPYNSFAMRGNQSERPIIVENHEGRTDRSHMYSPDPNTLHITIPALSIMGAKELKVTINKAAIGQRIDQDFTFELE